MCGHSLERNPVRIRVIFLATNQLPWNYSLCYEILCLKFLHFLISLFFIQSRCSRLTIGWFEYINLNLQRTGSEERRRRQNLYELQLQFSIACIILTFSPINTNFPNLLLFSYRKQALQVIQREVDLEREILGTRQMLLVNRYLTSVICIHIDLYAGSLQCSYSYWITLLGKATIYQIL